MKPHAHRDFGCRPPLATSRLCRRLCLPSEFCLRRRFSPGNYVFRRRKAICDSQRRSPPEEAKYTCEINRKPNASRRDVIIAPFLVIGANFLRSAVARADEKAPETVVAPPPPTVVKVDEKEETINSRIYDATVIGEPLALGKDKSKVWEKLMKARIVYMGEAEHVPIRDDRALELEIVKNLRKKCLETDRLLSLALEAFPSNLQEQLNQFMDKREILRLLCWT